MSSVRSGQPVGVRRLDPLDRWCVAVLSSWGLWSEADVARAYGVSPRTVAHHRHARAARLLEHRAAHTPLPGEARTP